MPAGRPTVMRDASILIPYAQNNKKHPQGQIDHIKKSIDEYGWMQPLVIDKNDVVVVGHGRLLAAMEMGIEEVPCVIADDLTEEQVRKYRLLDNKLSDLGEYDMEAVQMEIELLNDLELATLFDIDLTPENEVNEEEEDTVPEDPKIIVVEKGDVFQLWEHRLMCGDSTSIDDIDTLMDGQKADMVFTDPPYNTGMSEKTNNGSTWLNHMFNDDYSDEEWETFMSDFMTSINYSMKDDTVAYVCLDWRRNHELIPHIKSHFKLSNIIVWDKVVHGLGSDYKYTYELINVCKKWKPKMDTHQWEREYSDVWHIQRKIGKDEEHATKKPQEVCERPIRHGSKKGDIVVDIFGGSGSTMMACEKQKRKCYMMELDPKYIQTIIKRYHNYTNGHKEIKCLNRDLDINQILND